MDQRRSQCINLKGFLSFYVVNELSKKSLCGDDLAGIIGKWRGSKLTPGTIYPALKSLKKRKLIKHAKKGRKKIYFLTKEGIKEHKTARATIKKWMKNI